MRWRPLPAFAAIDFLSCMLVVFVAVALTSAPPQVKTYGAYAVVVTWPAGHNDIDLYVRDPVGAISSFANPQVGQMQLEHDDLGTAGSNYGRSTPNQERTVLRSTTPGQWVANVRLFARHQGTQAIPVTVTLWDLRTQDRVVYTHATRLAHQGDERTAFRFTIDHTGRLSGISHVPVSLASSTTTFASG
jgi:hypothetical protein